MTLEEAIQHCDEIVRDLTWFCNSPSKYIEQRRHESAVKLNQLASWLRELKERRKIESQQRWIPVTERLPEKPEGYPHCEIRRCYYLVSLQSGCVKTLGYEFDRDEWQVTGSPVVAWMPLPEPYKAERRTDDR